MKFPTPLHTTFRIIAFDWDGTAVANRADDATAVRSSLERLLRVGVPIVVITGTSFQNVDRQLGAWVHGPHKRNLYVATNRGSEVFGFDDEGAPQLLWSYRASPQEEKQLTATAEALQREITARTGLELRIVYDRLNRRKVDLIPLEEWKDPPKDQLALLIDAVESRFAGAGLPGGLRHAYEAAHRLARDNGLLRARITSDVKHIEIGLTDKADSIAWLLHELAAPHRISTDAILIGGDEFGPIAGFPGSDSKMMVPSADGAVFVSVGPEPGGAPPPVIHLGGGPQRFRELMRLQAARHPVELPAHPTADPDWLVVEEGFIGEREHEVESLFAIGNGRMGARGALAEGSGRSSPATFVAGLFEIPPGDPSAVPDLVRLPPWTHFQLRVDDQPIRLDTGEWIEHRRTLDLRQAMLWREWRHRDEHGRITRVRGMRLASQADRRLLLQSVTLAPENYSATIVVERDPMRQAVVTTLAGQSVAVATDGMLERPEAVEPAGAGHQREGQDTVEQVELEVQMGSTYRFDRLVSVATSRDSGEPLEDAFRHLGGVRPKGVQRLVREHQDAWRQRWRDSDVRIRGDHYAQRALRFAIYHLLSAVNPDDDRVSIGARALTGPAYKGHVFWDTEIFMLPFFTFTYPPAARALLMYRYHTLGGARAKARNAGYRGAMYAWESADTGEEVTPTSVLSPNGKIIPVLAGLQEHHISADVAYAVWQYWKATSDDEFLLAAGAEIVLETARFWASRVTRGSDDRFHILEVIGPDEYHEGIDDNAFTNVMAQWNLRCALQVAGLLQRRWPERWEVLARELQLSDEELEGWREVADAMYTGFDPSTGLFEQFRGFHGLEYIDLTQYEKRTAPMDVLLGRDRVKCSQVVKQADVIMMLALLWEQFPAEVRERNFRYYDPRTGHGSSLSPPVHALVAAKLGDIALAQKYFRQTAEIDLSDNMGNAAGGVHAAALGGLWQAAVFGFAGLDTSTPHPTLHPNLPSHWQSIELTIYVRGERFTLSAGEAPRRAAASQETSP
jgi:kojibiose phosphorylase